MDVLAPDGLSPHMVHNPPRRSNDDLCSVLQPPDLPDDILPAVDGQHLDPMHVFCQPAHLVGHLDRQLPCGTQGNGLKFLAVRVYLL